MDRLSLFAALAIVSVISGCSTSHTFLAKDSCGGCPVGCGESVSQETCQPLLLSHSTDGDQNCAAEGCLGCTGESDRRHRRNTTGLEGGFEYGKKNVVLDGAGWVMGIPSKLLLWNSKVDSHSVSPETQQQLRQYLASQGLSDVKVRINQYHPTAEWKRLANNKAIHPGWRYTVGAIGLAKYTLTPGRLFGADEYNPFTNTISLYSDRASIALREGAHAKQALDATYPGMWAASGLLPGNPLWIDTPAIREVISYTKQTGQRKLERESYLVLFPAFGARVGGSATFLLDASVGQAAQGAFALVGHAVGRTMAFRVSEGPVEMVKSVYGIVKKRPLEDDVWSTTPDQTVELQDPLPMNEIELTLVPMEVIYDTLN